MSIMGRPRTLASVMGAGAAMTTLIGAAPADAVTLYGVGSCPTAAQMPTVIAREVNADPAVRSAEAAHRARAVALTKAFAKERAALAAVAKARKTKSRKDNAPAFAKFRAARAARLAATRAEKSAAARLAAVRLAAHKRIAAWHVANPCVEVLSPPTQLQADAGNATVELQWQPVQNAPAYHVFRDGLLLAWTPTAVFIDTTARNGQHYTYTVRTLDQSFQSPDSAAVVAAPALPTPEGLVASPAAGAVSLRWTAVAHATSYDVVRNGAVVGSATASSYTDTGLAMGVSYSYAVRAVDNGARSAASSPATATTPIVTPAAPTGLNGSAGDTTATLTWTASQGATRYTVLRDGVVVGQSTSTSFGDTGLTNGSTYSYTVRASNSVGTSTPSSAATVTPKPPAPGAPTGLVAAAGDRRVTLVWTATPGATGYRVYRNGSFVSATSAPTFTNTGLTNGTTYSFTVRATNLGGTSPSSSSVSATPVLAVPAMPVAVSAAAGNTQVTLTWPAVAGATGYRVFRDGAEVAAPTTTSFTDTGLTNDQTYAYTLVATNGVGASAPSSPVNATPSASAPTAPSAPTGVVATAGDSSVSLTWSAATGATGYQVFRDGVQVGSPATAAFTDTGLANGTTYSYTVTAVNGGGISSASSPATATPLPPAPLAPSGLVATPGDASVSLTWTASSGATGYQVFRDGVQVGTPATAAFTDTGLTNNTAYSYTVRATNLGGTSTASAAVSATPVPAAPAAPTGVMATAGNAQVSLTWTTVPGATGYQVFRNGTQVGTPTAAAFTDTGLTNNTAYSYTVKATNLGGTSAASAAVSATPTNPLPLAPTGLKADSATNLNTGKLRLTWTASTGATSYSVYRDGVLLGTSTTATYTPTTTPYGATHSYTVTAAGATGTSPASAALVAGAYQGKLVDDVLGRTVYGQIQTYVVVTAAATKSTTGCWATYPTTSDSGAINPKAIPFLCNEVLTKQPTSATVATLISSKVTTVTQASATPPAFKTSLQDALTQAGM